MISRRRPASQSPAAPPQQPSGDRVSFVAQVSVRRFCNSGSVPGLLRTEALQEAREFFGPDCALEITDPWTASRDRTRGGYRAEITVTATPRSAK